MRVVARILAPLALLPATLLGAGCRNSCQDLCVEIADFAADQCGLEFPDAQLDQCIADHKSSTLEKGEAGTCRDGVGNVADEWDCEEIQAYFDAAGGDGGDTGG